MEAVMALGSLFPSHRCHLRKSLERILVIIKQKMDGSRRPFLFSYMCFVLRGSRASRNPSPMKLIHNTVSKINKPGKNQSHGAVCTYFTAVSSILPQLAVGV